MAKMDKTEKILEIVRNKGILRPRDLDVYGIARIYLSRLLEKKLLRRVGRGLYVSVDTDPTSNHTIAQVCKRLPNGVVCLLSALQFHELTTQQPYQVWLALDRKAWKPKVSDLPVNMVSFGRGPVFKEGIEHHNIEGVDVKMYNPPKTVADCFKYRNKIGLDIAMEALRECRVRRKCLNDELWHYAKICRVSNIMRPYMESMP
jgi:predicted transcriptional regulator of viral defense system